MTHCFHWLRLGKMKWWNSDLWNCILPARWVKFQMFCYSDPLWDMRLGKVPWHCLCYVFTSSVGMFVESFLPCRWCFSFISINLKLLPAIVVSHPYCLLSSCQSSPFFLSKETGSLKRIHSVRGGGGGGGGIAVVVQVCVQARMSVFVWLRERSGAALGPDKRLMVNRRGISGFW